MTGLRSGYGAGAPNRTVTAASRGLEAERPPGGETAFVLPALGERDGRP